MSMGTTRPDGAIKVIHPRGGNNDDEGRLTCHVAPEAEPTPGVGVGTSNGTGRLDGLWTGCPYRLGGHGQVATESGTVDGAAFENYSAALRPTGLTFMVGLWASDGVERPPRYQSKARIKGFHLVGARSTFSHVGDTII